MFEELNFEICKKNKKSRYWAFSVADGYLYLETGYGLQGVYLDTNIKNYRCPVSSVERFFKGIDELKIQSWPKAVPADYVPGKHVMGCDEHSWSITYKEQGKRNRRHIHGKGDFPRSSAALLFDPANEPSPEMERYERFLSLIASGSPDGDLYEWLEKE